MAHWRAMLDVEPDEPYRSQIVEQLAYVQRRADFVEAAEPERWLAGRVWSWPDAPA